MGNRRSFIKVQAMGLALAACRLSGCRSGGVGRTHMIDAGRAKILESRFATLIEKHRVPGCAAGLIRDAELVWACGFGLADVERALPMSPDSLLNVGSVTKTVTATAVLQLMEQGRLDLDTDVNDYISFTIRNPRHPVTPITARQLLTHRSSVKDGPLLGESYLCGDQPGTLKAWLAKYFSASDLTANFHTWAPGTADPPEDPSPYSNVGYGLLGHLVETVSGASYENYCREFIFRPLDMRSTGFRLEEIDTSRHAVPYKRLRNDFTPENLSHFDRSLAKYPLDERRLMPGELYPFCFYSFGTPPDGLMRTGVNDLSRFVCAWINHGEGRTVNGKKVRILRPETAAMALTNEHFGRKLCWNQFKQFYSSEEAIPGEPWVYHDGSDPGITAFAAFQPRQANGMLLIFNTSSSQGDILDSGIRALLEALASGA